MDERAYHGPADQRAVIDRRALADRLAALAPGEGLIPRATALLAAALAAGRAEVSKRLAHEPGNGRAAAAATAFLHDQLVRLAWDFVCGRLSDQRACGEVALAGLGGTEEVRWHPLAILT